MAYLKRLYLKKFSFLLILIQLSSHVLQGRERRTQPTPALQMGTGWDQANWPSPSGFYGAGMSGLLGSPSSFNLSDYVDTSTQPNTQLNSGTQTTAAAAVAQLLNCTLNCNNKLKRIVPVTMLQNLNLVLNFESIRLLFCLKVFVCYFVWKYSFAILFQSIHLLFFWKYSFAILCLQR